MTLSRSGRRESSPDPWPDGADAFAAEALDLAEQSAGVGVWSIDLRTGLVRATAQFFRIMGLEPTAEPIPVERIRALRHPADRERVVAGFRAVVEGGSDAYEMEYRIIRPDGQERWIFGRGRIVRDAGGHPLRYSGVDLDITERKSQQAELAAAKAALERMNEALEARVRERTAALEAEARRRAEAERRLQQSQKMEAIGQLTGGIAHDFNNILQVILGNLQIVELATRRGGAAPDAEKQALLASAVDTAQKAVRSAGQLVQRLLAFSRQQTLAPEALDANALVASMADMMSRTLGETVELATNLAPGLWTTFVDRNQLESAILNLVVNARDAMPTGGTLTIETANIAVGSGAAVDDVPAGEYVVITVTDTGTGIRPEILDKVFEPFFTTKEVGKGTGLGLSMVYGFVKQSGGHVRIGTASGGGCRVRLYLPRSLAGVATPAPVADRTTPAEALPRARDGETVLLVEDNDEVRRFGATALAGLGYAVVEARDGKAALAVAQSDGAARIALLFTDVVLPGGMDGRALADAVCRCLPGLPVLFASGYTRTTTLDAGDLVPDPRLLTKPYTIERLARGVREAIDTRQGSRSL
jgi:PAS domain S-box-containing protein